MGDVRVRSAFGRRGVLAAVVVVAVSVLVVLASLVVPADPASAETPAERCAREMAAYNSAWAQTWAASNGRPASEAPPPPVPYVCHDPGPTTTTTSQPPVVTAPTVPSDTNVPEGPGPNMGAHAPTDIPQPGQRPIVPVPTQAPERTEQADPGPIPLVEPTEAKKTRTATVTVRPRTTPNAPQGGGGQQSGPSDDSIVNDAYNRCGIYELGLSGSEERHLYSVMRRKLDDTQRYSPNASPAQLASQTCENTRGEIAHYMEQNFEKRFSMPGGTSEACKPEYRGPRCVGYVAVCPKFGTVAPPSSDSNYSTEVAEFVSKANSQLRSGKQFSRRSVTKQERRAASRMGDRWKARQPDNGDPRNAGKVAGHVPDTYWSGLQAESDTEFMWMTGDLNSSIGGQAGSYPSGYRVRGFTEGTWSSNNRCVPNPGAQSGCTMMIRTMGWDAVRGLCLRATPARFAMTVLAAMVAVTLVACSGDSDPGGESTSPETTDPVSTLNILQCPTPEEYRQAVGLGEVPEMTRSSDASGIACRYEYDNFARATSLVAMVNPHGDPLTYQVLPVLRERAAQRLTQPADGPMRARKVESVSGVGQEAYALVETSGDSVRQVDLWAVDGQFRVEVSGSFSSLDEAGRAANFWLAAIRSE